MNLFSSELPDWPRPDHLPGGGDAMVFYALYGTFVSGIEISPAYRTTGVPKGITVKMTSREQRPTLPFTDHIFARVLQTDHPELFKRIQAAPECIVIQGEIPDPADLNYLRDTIGVATYFLDQGAIGIIDPQQLKLYDAASWQKEIFEPNPPDWLNHVAILAKPEPDGTQWIHTRGLRKFGRPDISLRGVPRSRNPAAIELCQRLILQQANGARIPAGQEFQLPGLATPLTAHQAGTLDDPDFNNVHLALQFPAAN